MMTALFYCSYFSSWVNPGMGQKMTGCGKNDHWTPLFRKMIYYVFNKNLIR